MILRSVISIDSPVGRLLSRLLILEALMLLVPFVVCVALGESDWTAFAIAVAVSGIAGVGGGILFRGSSSRLTRRDAFLLISLVWVCFSAVSMIPFMMSGAHLSAGGAFFESVSGFTTTGATVLDEVESMGHGVLLWRAMTQWLGGLGIVLFLIALLPSLNGSGGLMMFNAEITGMTHDKLHPRIKQTAMSLWLVYTALTLVLICLLLCGGMSFFDSVCQAFATLSTGGFSTRNASIASWHSPYIATVVGVFMMLGGMNFALLYHACRGNVRAVFKNEVFRVYVAVIFVCVLVNGVFAMLHGETAGEPGATAVASFFHVTSAITSTGFSYSDYALWGALPMLLTVILMITGACAGSTTGAVKIDRVIAACRNMTREITHTVYPSHVKKVKVTGKLIDDRLMLRVVGFIGLYLLIFAIGFMVMAAYSYGTFDSIFASASCLGNNGLGCGATASGFGALPEPVKWVFSLQMLVGRLEIFPVLALFLPSFWTKR